MTIICSTHADALAFGDRCGDCASWCAPGRSSTGTDGHSWRMRAAFPGRCRFLEAIGCAADDLDCLYLKDVDEIIAAQEAARQYIPIETPISAFMQLLPSGMHSFFAAAGRREARVGLTTGVPLLPVEGWMASFQWMART